MLGLIIGIICTAAAVYLMVKKVRIEPVLVIFGILMMILAQLFGIGSVFSESVTGNLYLDAFEYFNNYLSKSFISTSSAIFIIFGYVKYCDAIEANQMLVRIILKPLRNIRSPYTLIPFCSIIAMCLTLFIASATGLSAMIMATMCPLLIKAGVSKEGSSSIGCVAYALPIAVSSSTFLAGTTALGIESADVSTFWFQRLLPVGLIAILAVGIIQLFWQRSQDAKMLEKSNQELKSGIDLETLSCPAWYALFPVLPCVLLIVFSNLVIKGIKMNMVTAFMVCLVIAVICDCIRSKSIETGFNRFKIFLDGVGYAVANVCMLISCCAVFTQGLNSLGVVTTLIGFAKSAGVSGLAMTALFSIAIMAITIVMGSGNAAFYAFVPIAVATCTELGTDAGACVVSLYLVSNLARSYSPVAGATITTAGLADMAPLDVVKRNILPVAVAAILCVILPVFVHF